MHVTLQHAIFEYHALNVWYLLFVALCPTITIVRYTHVCFVRCAVSNHHHCPLHTCVFCSLQVFVVLPSRLQVSLWEAALPCHVDNATRPMRRAADDDCGADETGRCLTANQRDDAGEKSVGRATLGLLIDRRQLLLLPPPINSVTRLTNSTVDMRACANKIFGTLSSNPHDAVRTLVSPWSRD